ncbi:hypothetical protein AB5I41_17430 [Sphingomonas sp. MMS24-JH45]
MPLITFAPEAQQDTVADDRIAGPGPAVQLPKHRAMGVVHVSPDHCIAVDVDAAKAIDEEARPDQRIFRDGDAIFDSRTEKQRLDEGI